MAHGRELRTWRRLSSLRVSDASLTEPFSHEIRCSTDDSTGSVLSERRKDDRPGVAATAWEGIVAVGSESYSLVVLVDLDGRHTKMSRFKSLVGRRPVYPGRRRREMVAPVATARTCPKLVLPRS